MPLAFKLINRLRLIRYLQLVVDLVDVLFDGADSDPQLITDLLIQKAF